MYNNRVYYANYFDSLTLDIYMDGELIKTYSTDKDISLKLGAYKKKKITVKVPMSKVYNLTKASDLDIGYSYYYYYTIG